MKKLACALMLCLGVVACAAEDQDELSGSATNDTPTVVVPTPTEPVVTELAASELAAPEVAITGDELGTLNDGKATAAACSREYTGVCIDWYHTCNFQCCSNAIRSIQEACGNCQNRAESWCGSGVRKVWWTP